MYCEFCNEENIIQDNGFYWYSEELRPFNYYCNDSCMDALSSEILDYGYWDNHFSDNGKYKKELENHFKNKTFKNTYEVICL